MLQRKNSLLTVLSLYEQLFVHENVSEQYFTGAVNISVISFKQQTFLNLYRLKAAQTDAASQQNLVAEISLIVTLCRSVSKLTLNFIFSIHQILMYVTSYFCKCVQFKAAYNNAFKIVENILCVFFNYPCFNFHSNFSLLWPM